MLHTQPSTKRPSFTLTLNQTIHTKPLIHQATLVVVCPCPAGLQLQQNQTPHLTNQPPSPLILHRLYPSPPSPRQLFPTNRPTNAARPHLPQRAYTTAPNIYSFNSALSPHKKISPLNQPSTKRSLFLLFLAIKQFTLKQPANKCGSSAFAPKGKTILATKPHS